jgi:hypothetical protein
LTSFDPSSLARYTVIALPWKFEGDAYAERKLFVVIGHCGGHAICLKTTSQTNFYKNNKDAMAGVVFYNAGDLRCFPVDTAIQPDNCIPIPHKTIAEERERLRLEVREILPSDFDDRLQKAIDNSVTLDDRKRDRLAKARNS